MDVKLKFRNYTVAVVNQNMKRYSVFRLLYAQSSNLSPKSVRPICSGVHGASTVPEDCADIVETFISIFTKRSSSIDAPELQNLAPLLTTKVVESVLEQLKSWKVARRFFTWASAQCGYKHNCYAYNVMAAKLSHARQNAQMKELAEDLVSSRCPITPGALGYFIRCLGSLGMVEEANLMFDQVKQLDLCSPNIYTYNCLLETIAKSDQVELAEMRFREVNDLGWNFDKHTLTPLLQIYCNSGNYDMAMNVFNGMSEHNWLDAHVLSIVAMFFSKSGQMDKVFDLIERMEARNVGPTEQTFCVLIHGFVRESEVDKALQMFDKMKRSGFAPSIHLYDVLIEGLCRNEQLQKAVNLFLEMKDHGIAPDVRLLEKLASFFSEEEFIQLIEEIPEGMDSRSTTLRYNCFLSHYTKTGLIDKAYHLLHAMIGDNPSGIVEVDKLIRNKETVFADTTSFRIVINGLLQAGKVDTALTLFQDMVHIGCSRSVELYNNLINSLCTSNRFSEALELLEEMKKSGLVPTQFTHNCIFGYLCRKQDVIGAVDMVKEMRRFGHEPWIKHSSLLIKQLCNHGRVTEACSFLNDMVQEGFLPDIVAYSAALRGLIMIGKLDLALKLFQNLCALGRRPDVITYNILISGGLCKAERVSEANDLFNEMLKYELVPSVVTCNLMIDGWCKKGDVNQAMLCLSRMLEDKQEPNVVTYTTMIHGICNAGRPDDAIVLWEEMGRKRCEPNSVAFMAIVHGLSKCGRPNEALQYLREMLKKEMKPDTYVYVALLKAFLSNQSFDAALQILKELSVNGKFPDPGEKDYLTLQDTLIKLAENDTTSSTIRDLIAGGSIPPINHLYNGKQE